MRRGWPCAASRGPSAMRHSAVRRAWQVVRIGDATPARPAAPAPRRPCVPAGSVYFSVKMNIHASVPVGVLGASGYVGQELLRLLARHPGASVVFATAESAAGEVVEGHRLLRTDDAPLGSPASFWRAFRTAFSAPHRAQGGAPANRAVDLSADFRLSPEAVYGLTEVTRRRVAAAGLVANPGCYPTAAVPALIPPPP